MIVFSLWDTSESAGSPSAFFLDFLKTDVIIPFCTI